MLGGALAVQLFYMLSGFLISYVLTERKAYASTRAFYINRFLRLYPIYFLIGVLSLIGHLCSSHSIFMQTYRGMPMSGFIFLVVTNAVLLFQDWTFFLGVQNSDVVFSADYKSNDLSLSQGLLVQPAWTLGVELSFYLLAPFILTRRRIVFSLLGASIALRVVFMWQGIASKDPWSYRFFPTELALFLLGTLSHQLLTPLCKRLPAGVMRTLPILATVTFVTISLTYFSIPINEPYRSICLFATFFAFLPLLFIFQNRYTLDQSLGELSYPLYVSHWLVRSAVMQALPIVGIASNVAITLVAVGLSIIAAALLNQFVGKPFEKIRNKVRLGSASRIDVR